jgi:hypothetical protein
LSPETLSSSGGSSFAARYEGLREQVLIGDSRGPGLAILLSRGMKAWLNAVNSLDVPTPPEPENTADAEPLQTVPGGYRAQLTAVLAGMVLHGWEQGRRA